MENWDSKKIVNRLISAFAASLLVLAACDEPAPKREFTPVRPWTPDPKPRVVYGGSPSFTQPSEPVFVAKPLPASLTREEREIQLFRWECDLLQGKTSYDPCSFPMEERRRLLREGDLRSCDMQRFLNDLRFLIAKRHGSAEERVSSALDDLLAQHMDKYRASKEHWYVTAFSQTSCTSGKCRFVNEFSFLNDRKLVARIVSGDQSVYANMAEVK